jgi:hypothetical protein
LIDDLLLAPLHVTARGDGLEDDVGILYRLRHDLGVQKRPIDILHAVHRVAWRPPAV